MTALFTMPASDLGMLPGSLTSRIFTRHISLSASFLSLLLFASSIRPTSAQPWPYNLPKHQKYHPEHAAALHDWPAHEELVRKRLEVERKMLTEIPIGIKGFGGDPDEMFFPEYWVFAGDPLLEPESVQSLQHDQNTPTVRWSTARAEHSREISRNYTVSSLMLPSFLVHLGEHSIPGQDSWGSTLEKRDFQCPNETASCSNIDRPNSCCGVDETCMIVADTGLGDVGCCPNGQDCSGSISQCDTAHGYHSCAGSSNGGCCIPGFACQGVGCIYNTTSTTELFVTVTITPTASDLPTSTSVIVLTPSTTYVTVIGTSTQASVTPPPTDIVSVTGQPGLACVSGFNSCAESVGGGCCPTDRACATNGLCPPIVTVTVYQPTTVSDGINPAVRPTDSDSSLVTPPALSTITSANICPSSYYQCSAYYVGGCCQVGRDCSSTNCPSRYTETLESGSVVVIVPTVIESGSIQPTSTITDENPTTTIVIPTTTGVDAPGSSNVLPGEGVCQNGWFTCGFPEGGGCCPSGYECGASCTATAGVGPSKVAKATPLGSASSTFRAPGSGIVALCVLAMAILLDGGA